MDPVEVLRRLGGRQVARCAGCRGVFDVRDLKSSVWFRDGRSPVCTACQDQAMARDLARVRREAERRIARIQANADDLRSLLRPSSVEYRKAVATLEHEMTEAMSWWKMGG